MVRAGRFGDGESSLTATAGPNGEVVGRGLKPNRVAGPFQIRVTASARGESATATIHQTNVEPAAGGGSGKKIALVALIGGAAIGGIIAATRGGGGPGTTAPAGATATGGSAPGGVSVVPGAPSFGPPR